MGGHLLPQRNICIRVYAMFTETQARRCGAIAMSGARLLGSKVHEESKRWNDNEMKMQYRRGSETACLYESKKMSARFFLCHALALSKFGTTPREQQKLI